MTSWSSYRRTPVSSVLVVCRTLERNPLYALRNLTDVALPSADLCAQGVPARDVHLTLDITALLERKLASMAAHRTQTPSDWPFLSLPKDVAVALLGREYCIRAYPEVTAHTPVASDLFVGLQSDIRVGALPCGRPGTQR
jgi:LmbE family N-acetylglucosaminyl deacetylase